MREGTIWTIQHPYWHVRKGAAGGAPLVAGANQTGNILHIDGATPSVVGWLQAGDMIQVPGCAVVFDVSADCNSDGGGLVSIPISPPIFVGKSPADDAVVTVDPTLIKFNVAVASISAYPDMDVTRYIDAGMVVTFREQPT